MKNMRKLFAVVLAVMMVMTLATTAFAADDDTYAIYQVFTGDYSNNGTLSNVLWGQNGTGTEGEAVEEDILNELTAVNNASDAEQLAVITKYVDWDSSAYRTGSDTTYTGLADGYYLVKSVKPLTDTNGNEYYTTYVVKVVDGTLTFSPKGDAPTVNKVIIEGEKEVVENEASIGDIIDYKFTGTLPSNIADYAKYFYRFTDTMTKGLTYVTDSIKVTVNDVDVTDYFYKSVQTYDAKYESGTQIMISIQDLLSLELLKDGSGSSLVGDITSETKVVVTYQATLNADVNVEQGVNNRVKLQYSNDPNADGVATDVPPNVDPQTPPNNTNIPTGVTPEDVVYTYTTEIILNKKDGSNNNAVLTGAAFQITGEGVNLVVTTGEVYVESSDEGTYYKLANGTYTTTVPTTENASDYEDSDTKYAKKTSVTIDSNDTATDYTAFVDAYGQLKFTGLGAGTYTITEVVTPDGYNTIKPITVTIGWDYNNVEENKDEASGCVWTYKWGDDPAGSSNTYDVLNYSGSTLPTTGGIGTTIFYVVGGILVLAAVVLLVTKKRMATAE